MCDALEGLQLAPPVALNPMISGEGPESQCGSTQMLLKSLRSVGETAISKLIPMPVPPAVVLLNQSIGDVRNGGDLSKPSHETCTTFLLKGHSGEFHSDVSSIALRKRKKRTRTPAQTTAWNKERLDLAAPRNPMPKGCGCPFDHEREPSGPGRKCGSLPVACSSSASRNPKTGPSW